MKSFWEPRFPGQGTWAAGPRAVMKNSDCFVGQAIVVCRLSAAARGSFSMEVPSQLALPEILEGNTLYLEGEELRVVEPGHTDTSHSPALHVPSIGLVISGDAVYNNTHRYLAECDDKARGEWLCAEPLLEE